MCCISASPVPAPKRGGLPGSSANAPPSTLGSSSIAASSVRILRSAPCFAAENTQHASEGPGEPVDKRLRKSSPPERIEGRDIDAGVGGFRGGGPRCSRKVDRPIPEAQLVRETKNRAGDVT